MSQRFPNQIERLVLFGSKARGDDRPDSDLDLLIVLRGGQKPSAEGFYSLGATDPVWREIVGSTFDFLLEYGVLVSPTVLSKEEYRIWSPFTARIKQEGIELWPNNCGKNVNTTSVREQHEGRLSRRLTLLQTL